MSKDWGTTYMLQAQKGNPLAIAMLERRREQTEASKHEQKTIEEMKTALIDTDKNELGQQKTEFEQKYNF